MIVKYWSNERTRLFLVQDDGAAKFLRYACLQSVLWPEHGKDSGRIIVKALMPVGRDLIEFPNGADLALVDGFCGDPSVYDEKDEVMRFSNCGVVRKWMVKLSSLTGPGEAIYLRLSLVCNIKVKAADD